MAWLWFTAAGEPERISTARAIQAEIAAIEGRGLPEAVQAPLPPAPVPPDGELAAIIRAEMDGPPPPAPPGPHLNAATDHRPPGGGAGMVNTGATIPLFALCLSGGGIRSASFCLGVVQALARVGLLKRFHYLSTVSGGGYTGSLISSLIATLRGVEPAERALADPQSYPAVDWLARLRNYTSFLAPRLSLTSLDIWAAISLGLSRWRCCRGSGCGWWRTRTGHGKFTWRSQLCSSSWWRRATPAAWCPATSRKRNVRTCPGPRFSVRSPFA